MRQSIKLKYIADTPIRSICELIGNNVKKCIEIGNFPHNQNDVPLIRGPNFL